MLDERSTSSLSASVFITRYQEPAHALSLATTTEREQGSTILEVGIPREGIRVSRKETASLSYSCWDQPSRMIK